MKAASAKTARRWAVWLLGMQFVVSAAYAVEPAPANAAASTDETDWFVDLDDAKQAAAKTDKPLMLVFR